MTLSIRKNIPTPLEEEYSRMRKRPSDGYNKNPNRAINVEEETSSNSPIDTVTLSSKEDDSESLPKLKPSLSVNTDEKKALYAPLSVYT